MQPREPTPRGNNGALWNFTELLQEAAASNSGLHASTFYSDFSFLIELVQIEDSRSTVYMGSNPNLVCLHERLHETGTAVFHVQIAESVSVLMTKKEKKKRGQS